MVQGQVYGYLNQIKTDSNKRRRDITNKSEDAKNKFISKENLWKKRVIFATLRANADQRMGYQKNVDFSDLKEKHSQKTPLSNRPVITITTILMKIVFIICLYQ